VSLSSVVSDNEMWPSWWEVMKLRAAVGESGKAPGIFDAVRTYSPSAGNDDQPGITPNNLGDPDLGPERTREIEVGFEGSAFDNRVCMDSSYYHAVTTDTLVQKQFPPSLGFADPQLAKIGEILNKGMELQLGVTP
jgi:outer membrane receptor protein involved in Fe transport